MATDLAEALVQAGVPFRHAHERVGALVADCERRGIDLVDLDPDEVVAELPELDRAAVPSLLDPAAGVARRNAVQGPAPDRVRAQIARLRALLPPRPPRA